MNRTEVIPCEKTQMEILYILRKMQCDAVLQLLHF